VLGVPAEIGCLCGKGILPLGRLTIVLHLGGAGLAQIDEGLTGRSFIGRVLCRLNREHAGDQT
jgi:hypothetical protein